MRRLLRIGDRVAYKNLATGVIDFLDVGTVCEVHRMHRGEKIVVAWDTGDVDEFLRNGDPVPGYGPGWTESEMAVRWTGRRWSRFQAEEHLRLAVVGALDDPDSRWRHGFKVRGSERYVARLT